MLTLVLLGGACADGGEPTGPGAAEANAPAAALVSNTWTSRRSMPEGRHHHGAGVVANGAGEPILYVLGGYVQGEDFEVPTRILYAYNFTTDVWTTKSARGGTAFSNGVGVIQGKLYQSGGFTGTRALKTLSVYDPAQDAFTLRAALPMASMSGVSGVIGGRLYVLTGAGGACACNVTKKLYRYDPGANTWTALRAAPDAHIGGAGGVIGGRFYVAGGRNAQGLSAQAHVYDPATNQWTAVASMPEAREDLAGAVLNGKLYVIAGQSVYAYDPGSNTWVTVAPMNGWRHSLAAAAFVSKAGNPRMLAVGGVGDPGWADARNEVYAP